MMNAGPLTLSAMNVCNTFKGLRNGSLTLTVITAGGTRSRLQVFSLAVLTIPGKLRIAMEPISCLQLSFFPGPYHYLKPDLVNARPQLSSSSKSTLPLTQDCRSTLSTSESIHVSRNIDGFKEFEDPQLTNFSLHSLV